MMTKYYQSHKMEIKNKITTNIYIIMIVVTVTFPAIITITSIVEAIQPSQVCNGVIPFSLSLSLCVCMYS